MKVSVLSVAIGLFYIRNSVSISVNFEEFEAGDIVTELGLGITVSALKKLKGGKHGALVPANAMIFDSSNPTGDDYDIGSPNSDFGGPGLGAGGSNSSIYANKEEHGKILIISEDNDLNDPDDNKFGGVVTFNFTTTVEIDAIGILDTEKHSYIDVTVLDGSSVNLAIDPTGDNGFNLVLVQVANVVRLDIYFADSFAITSLELAFPVPSDLPSIMPSNAPSDPKRSEIPSYFVSDHPSSLPSDLPSSQPSDLPSSTISQLHSDIPSSIPSEYPFPIASDNPSMTPVQSTILSDWPSSMPSDSPSVVPISLSSDAPSNEPSDLPSDFPSDLPSDSTSDIPSFSPEGYQVTDLPSMSSDIPSIAPSTSTSDIPSTLPSDVPSAAPMYLSSDLPSAFPSDFPSSLPSDVASITPFSLPSDMPSNLPSDLPSSTPTALSTLPYDFPSSMPSDLPSYAPFVLISDTPSNAPSGEPTKSLPSDIPSSSSSIMPSSMTSDFPSFAPFRLMSDMPSTIPSDLPSQIPSDTPSLFHEGLPSDVPSVLPTFAISGEPSSKPAGQDAVNCVVDFEQFTTGDEVSDLGSGVRVIAEKRRSARGGLKSAQAMIFDSSSPNGNNFQLGTPHSSFGGPGVGKGGRHFEPYENRDSKGMVLIVSEDNNSSNPDASKFGGVFTFIFSTPRKIETIGILNVERVVQFEVLQSSGAIVSIDSDIGGKNSFQQVKIGLDDVIMIVITFLKSGAITELELSCF